MDEFGESRAFYIWPAGHVDGQPFPEDFNEDLENLLRLHGFEMERV